MRTYIPGRRLVTATMWDDGLVLRNDPLLETRAGELLRVAWDKKVCVALFTLEGEEPDGNSGKLITKPEHAEHDDA